MQKQKKSSKNLLDEINTAGRKMSTATVMFHQTVAEKVGISGTDHKYLDLLIQEGEMTAGKLAELSGLTTGAVTGIIDRLERQALVTRKNDPHDRRKVLVVPNVKGAMGKMAPVFNSLHSDLKEFYGRFTDRDLHVILRFLHDTAEFLDHKTRQLRKERSR